MLQECEYLEQDMDEIQREYEERKQEWELLEKTIKIRKKKKSLILIRDLMKGRRRAEVNILLRQGLEVFLPARQDFYGADLWRNSRQCLPHRLHGSAFLLL